MITKAQIISNLKASKEVKKLAEILSSTKSTKRYANDIIKGIPHRISIPTEKIYPGMSKRFRKIEKIRETLGDLFYDKKNFYVISGNKLEKIMKSDATFDNVDRLDYELGFFNNDFLKWQKEEIISKMKILATIFAKQRVINKIISQYNQKFQQTLHSKEYPLFLYQGRYSFSLLTEDDVNNLKNIICTDIIINRRLLLPIRLYGIFLSSYSNAELAKKTNISLKRIERLRNPNINKRLTAIKNFTVDDLKKITSFLEGLTYIKIPPEISNSNIRQVPAMTNVANDSIKAETKKLKHRVDVSIWHPALIYNFLNSNGDIHCGKAEKIIKKKQAKTRKYIKSHYFDTINY